MDKETFILMTAHSGMSLAASMIAAAAAQLDRQAALTVEPVTKRHFEELARRKHKLAQLLGSADAGIADYLNHI